jgi:hypothetical protein
MVSRESAYWALSARRSPRQPVNIDVRAVAPGGTDVQTAYPDTAPKKLESVLVAHSYPRCPSVPAVAFLLSSRIVASSRTTLALV